MKQQENKFTYNNILNLGVWSNNLIELDTQPLIEAAYKIQKNYPSSLKSNIGGYQSPSNLIDIKEFSKLTSLINNTMFSLTKTSNFLVTSMWLNISPPNSYNDIHTHHTSTSKFSGVLYIKTPPNSGCITFSNPLEIDLFSKFQPYEKSILIFHSCLPHSVEPNFSQEDRISIAFNFN